MAQWDIQHDKVNMTHWDPQYDKLGLYKMEPNLQQSHRNIVSAFKIPFPLSRYLKECSAEVSALEVKIVVTINYRCLK